MQPDEIMALQIAVMSVEKVHGTDSPALPILRRLMGAPNDSERLAALAQPAPWEDIDAASTTPTADVYAEAVRRHAPARPERADARMWSPGFTVKRERTPPRKAADGVDGINPNAYSVLSETAEPDPARGPIPPEDLAAIRELRSINPEDPDVRE